jgi:F-type H+-transporting ATPase subunit b
MLIDWFTVGAQVVNFLILVWLLKRFLYKPIIAAIDAREKRIVDEHADADAKRAEAVKEQGDFENRNKAFNGERDPLLAKAAGEAKAEGARLLDQARKEADALRANQENALRNERTVLSHEITRLASEEVFGIARKTLADLATASLEERMAAAFTRCLRAMDGKAKEALATALKAPPEPALIRSAFDLPADQRAVIQNALNESFSAEIPLRFETAAEVVCGIELTSHGQKIGWSIAEYLRSLDQKVGALLAPQAAPAPKSEAHAEAA